MKAGDYFIFGVMNQIPTSTPKIIAKAIQSASRYCLRDLTAKIFCAVKLYDILTAVDN
jgi:hypothetical protein